MSTSRVVALRAALKTAIENQLTSDAVTATTTAFDPGDEQTKADCVWLGGMRSSQEEHAFGGSRMETILVDGFIRVLEPGAGDTAGTAAETRAHQILASVETALRDDITAGSTVFDCVITGHESDGATTPEGRVAVVAFDLEAEAHI